MEPTIGVLTVSGVLIGFLFTGFWWALGRELTFTPEERHFKLGYVVLILTMALLGYYGIILPLRRLAAADPALIPSYRGVFLALVGILGYMLIELGHYSIFQLPKYSTGWEWAWLGLTVTGMAGLVIWWAIR